MLESEEEIIVSMNQRVVPVNELEAAISRLLQAQQPFHTTVSNQLASMDGRIALMNTVVSEIRREMDHLAAAKMETSLGELEDRVIQLELERSRRDGAMALFKGIPQGLGWIVIVVAVAIAYYMGKGHLGG